MGAIQGLASETSFLFRPLLIAPELTPTLHACCDGSCAAVAKLFMAKRCFQRCKHDNLTGFEDNIEFHCAIQSSQCKSQGILE